MRWHRVTTNKRCKEQKLCSEDDLSPAFPMQMVCFRESMQAEIAKLHSITELAHMLIVENTSVSSGCADIVTALLLFLTLPVTVAAAERSSSKLKIIKNYLRNTMEKRACGDFRYW